MLDVWAAQNSFEIAINSKMGGFAIDSPTSDGPKDRGDLLLDLVEEQKDDKKISVLDSEAVVAAAKAAHQALIDWRSGIAEWKPVLNTRQKKEELDPLFEAYDTACANLESYMAALRSHAKKKEGEVKGSDKVEEKRITGCLTRFYSVLVNNGVPKLIAKVHIITYSHAFQ